MIDPFPNNKYFDRKGEYDVMTIPKKKKAKQDVRRTGYTSYRTFSVLNRPPPKYEGHIPLTRVERGALAVGSAVLSLFNPRRAGRRILRDRPRISSKTMSVEYLRSLPENSVGRAYVGWLDREGVSPDTRSAVQYIDDEECAYVMQRYRECHDFYHALCGLPVFREGEVALKAFEFANTLLPMTGLSVFAVTTLKKKERERFWGIYGPWAVENGVKAKEVINVYWEEWLERDVEELRRELGIEKPPDLRGIRATEKEKRKREKEKERREAMGSAAV
ncbi:Ubiquinone biosynthesis protein [Coniosporium tulheliwenetii]|uniref:Ubiquinone biosynthesis protein n=1 Tax=Coniosporium tulheliwenetii TaxID=3383036 RepID=A0ACC2Z1Y3_9PEZI|nr:Ubiquinone biosynthesis protein [Cladosporium sp. JES 115]